MKLPVLDKKEDGILDKKDEATDETTRTHAQLPVSHVGSRYA